MNIVTEDTEMSLTGHLDELRGRLIKCIISIVVLAIVAFACGDNLFALLLSPSSPEFIFNKFILHLSQDWSMPQLAINQSEITLINTKMAGQFNLHLKVALMAALAGSMPVILWHCWQFIAPALSLAVRKSCRNMVWVVLLLFFIGLAFGYYFISPLAVNFLSSYTLSNSIINYIDVSSYISTVSSISLATGLVFQLPVCVYILSTAGIITSASMARYRKVAFAAIIIFAAIITPPDLFSQLLIAIPLYGLYELSIVIARKEENKKK